MSTPPYRQHLRIDGSFNLCTDNLKRDGGQFRPDLLPDTSKYLTTYEKYVIFFINEVIDVGGISPYRGRLWFSSFSCARSRERQQRAEVHRLVQETLQQREHQHAQAIRGAGGRASDVAPSRAHFPYRGHHHEGQVATQGQGPAPSYSPSPVLEPPRVKPVATPLALTPIPLLRPTATAAPSNPAYAALRISLHTEITTLVISQGRLLVQLVEAEQADPVDAKLTKRLQAVSSAADVSLAHLRQQLRDIT